MIDIWMVCVWIEKRHLSFCSDTVSEYVLEKCQIYLTYGVGIVQCHCTHNARIFFMSVSAFRKSFFKGYTILISPKKNWKAGGPANRGVLKSLNADIQVLRLLPERNGTLTQREYEEGSSEELGCVLPVQFFHEPKQKSPTVHLENITGPCWSKSRRNLMGCLIEQALRQKPQTSYKRVEGAQKPFWTLAR